MQRHRLHTVSFNEVLDATMLGKGQEKTWLRLPQRLGAPSYIGFELSSGEAEKRCFMSLGSLTSWGVHDTSKVLYSCLLARLL